MVNEDQINLNIKGCVKNNGVLFIPLPELIKLFDRLPYHLGRDFKELLSKSTVSDKIPETNKSGDVIK